MVLDAQEIPNIPVPVKEEAHWRVIIRPVQFERERVASLQEAWKLVESCRVRLRGWDYPHVDRDNRANGEDWIASWCDFLGRREYWRFFQSGQFIHLFSFWEEKHSFPGGRAPRLRSKPADFRESGYVDIVETLYTSTEIFEFAARLAQRGAYTQGMNVSIQLNGIRNRLLVSLDPMRMWHSFCPANVDSLSRRNEFRTGELMSRSPELARDFALWLFERFGWVDVPPEFIVGEQRKLLAPKERGA